MRGRRLLAAAAPGLGGRGLTARPQARQDSGAACCGKLVFACLSERRNALRRARTAPSFWRTHIMTLTRNDVLQIVRSRYTTKHYDPSKAVSEEDFNALLEVLRLSPSSVNSQPWEFFIARTPEARARLLPAIPDFNRQRVADASHVIVFVVHEKLDEQYLQELLAKETADGRFGNEEARAGQDAGRRHFVGLHSLSQQELLSWEMRQSYIAQGFLLFAAAAMGIDSTPIEGADFSRIDRILGLREQGLRSFFAVSLGYRAQDDSNASRPKSRWSAERIFHEIA